MQIVFDAYKNTKQLHHAYLIEGEEGEVMPTVSQFIEEVLNTPISSNPDVWIRSYERFGIDEGREIRTLQSQRSVSGAQRFFVISTRFFTREAQNALLKMFEEPSQTSHFFIITPQSDALLPTLKSRLFIVQKESHGISDAQDLLNAKDFLKETIAERLKMIEPIVKDKDVASTMLLLNNLEVLLSESNLPRDKVYAEYMSDIVYARQSLYGNAPSIKMQLEHLSVVLPRIE